MADLLGVLGLMAVVAGAVTIIFYGHHVIYRSGSGKPGGDRVRCVYPNETRPCLSCEERGYCAASEEGLRRKQEEWEAEKRRWEAEWKEPT